MIKQIYKKLYNHFGKQNWWPYTLDNKLHPEHHGIPPKNIIHRFEIIIGAILTQNTNWKNVEKAIYNLNKNSLVDIKKIKKINQDKLAQLIRPSGYYNQKAERLKLAADFFDKNIDDFLKNKKHIEKLRDNLLSIKGIGPETADSILLYAFQIPTFVIDAYIRRIAYRLGIIKNKNIKYDELQNIFLKKLNKIKNKTKIFNEYHALLVELGKNYCKSKNPLCGECPLGKICMKRLI